MKDYQIAEHEFAHRTALPGAGWIVVTASRVPHQISTIHGTLSSAERRAEELTLKTGDSFVVLKIEGKTIPPIAAVGWDHAAYAR